jgi:hypothetical protein
MRAFVSTVVVLYGMTAVLAAQDSEVVKVTDLAAPTSPAFVLLDITPSAVERPENPKPFVLNLLNRLATSNGLPKDYALNTAPYWFKSHPNLTFEQYQNATLRQSVLQSFSVSVATAPLESEAVADAPGARLALGFRTNIWNGKPNSKMAAVLKQLEAVNIKILDGQTVTPEDRAAAKKAALDVQALDSQRVGLFLTLAGGQAWEATGDSFENVQATRRGFWATPAYRVEVCNGSADDASQCTATVDFIGVVRTLKDADQDLAWDYGGRLLWRPTPQLYLSIESLQRRNGARQVNTSTAKNSSRTVGFVEYRIRAEYSLYGAFGKDFEKDGGVRPLVSILGLNVGFGSPTIKASR